MAVRDLVDQTCAARRPAPQAGHVGLDPGFVDEHQTAGIDADFTDTQAVASIARITDGGFRLRHRLFTQIERIMQINELTVITDEVVEAARSTLVIGAT